MKSSEELAKEYLENFSHMSLSVRHQGLVHLINQLKGETRQACSEDIFELSRSGKEHTLRDAAEVCLNLESL